MVMTIIYAGADVVGGRYSNKNGLDVKNDCCDDNDDDDSIKWLCCGNRSDGGNKILKKIILNFSLPLEQSKKSKPKTNKVRSFDQELTDTSKKALKQFRTR